MILATLGILFRLASPDDSLVGEAAWYGREKRGFTQANGKPFDERRLTCATWFWPLGTDLLVTSLSDGRSVMVTVTDRGPAWRLVVGKKRYIDLSWLAFSKIANPNFGHVKVRIERVRMESSEDRPLFNVTPVYGN